MNNERTKSVQYSEPKLQSSIKNKKYDASVPEENYFTYNKDKNEKIRLLDIAVYSKEGIADH